MNEAISNFCSICTEILSSALKRSICLKSNSFMQLVKAAVVSFMKMAWRQNEPHARAFFLWTISAFSIPRRQTQNVLYQTRPHVFCHQNPAVINDQRATQDCTAQVCEARFSTWVYAFRLICKAGHYADAGDSPRPCLLKQKPVCYLPRPAPAYCHHLSMYRRHLSICGPPQFWLKLFELRSHAMSTSQFLPDPTCGPVCFHCACLSAYLLSKWFVYSDFTGRPYLSTGPTPSKSTNSYLPVTPSSFFWHDASIKT